MLATLRAITTSGVGHHQCSQKAPKPWLPSNPAPKTPSSTNPAPSTRPTRFTLRAYRSSEGYPGNRRSSAVAAPDAALESEPQA
jgi:hypothetical protein